MPEYRGQLNAKLPNIGESIFSKMTNLANEFDALNMAQGFPDFNPDKNLLKICANHFKDGNHQYAHMAGMLPLRETIAKYVEKWYSTFYNPETEITIVPGATAGIYAALTALLKENDEVIIFEPAYDSYVPAIMLQGAKPVYVTLTHPDYQIDWDHVRKLINFKTKAIIINTPNNPTGCIFTSQDMMQLSELVKNTDIWILSDEVYEHIIFDGYEHQSVARYPKLAERSIIASSFGKTLHVTGWKLGYLLGPEKLMKEVRKAYQYMIFAANRPLQNAINEYINTYPEKLHLDHFYSAKRDLFITAMKSAKFKILAPKGTYFALLDYTKLSDMTDTAYADFLVKEHKIATVPTSVFYKNKIDNKTLRICFAKEDKTLLKAAEILCNISK